MRDMRVVWTAVFAALLFVLGMIGMVLSAIFEHNESASEAWKKAPQQVWESLIVLLGLAWQYKLVTIVAFAIVIAILFVRQVPAIRHQ